MSIDKGELYKWTLKINETNLKPDSKLFLTELQTKYNIYTNLHQNWINRIKNFSSPFEYSHFTAYFYGNSHMRQIIEGSMCLIEDAMQKQNIPIKDYGITYIPKLQDNSKIVDIQYNELWCLGAIHVEDWNNGSWNALHLNESIINPFSSPEAI